MKRQHIEKYEQVLENIKIDIALAKAEAEYKSGNMLLDAKEVLSSLKNKCFKLSNGEE